MLDAQRSISSPSFQILQPDWIELTPYGDFPHPRGLQRMDRLAAERIVGHFNSFWAKLGRKFAGVPIYIGHPDVAELAQEYSDKKAYGWITELKVAPNGLLGKAKWSAQGREILENAHYKFYSPLLGGPIHRGRKTEESLPPRRPPLRRPDQPTEHPGPPALQFKSASGERSRLGCTGARPRAPASVPR